MSPTPKQVAIIGLRSKYPTLTPTQVDALADVMLAASSADFLGVPQEAVVLVAISATKPQRRTA